MMKESSYYQGKCNQCSLRVFTWDDGDSSVQKLLDDMYVYWNYEQGKLVSNDIDYALDGQIQDSSCIFPFDITYERLKTLITFL